MLHLIATHHGYARPFAPLVFDPEPPGIAAQVGTESLAVETDERQSWPAAHHLSSGNADRFGRIIRRHGWWGAAFLEAVLRLADWTASSSAAGQARHAAGQFVAAGGER